MSRGEIVVNPEYPHKLAPNRDAVHAGSTILHETLHETGHGTDRHPWIRPQQNEFAKRRYQTKGIARFHLPYPPELINVRADY